MFLSSPSCLSPSHDPSTQRDSDRFRCDRCRIVAQGFADPRLVPGRATMRYVRRVIDRVGIIEVDSVNLSSHAAMTARSSPDWGPYDTSLVDRARDIGQVPMTATEPRHGSLVGRSRTRTDCPTAPAPTTLKGCGDGLPQFALKGHVGWLLVFPAGSTWVAWDV
jgi:hypothetical protein